MAKMMLHRDVLKNFGKLPAKVQKKVYELTYKFESDSTQASIHLEPIGAAKDKKVRSARWTRLPCHRDCSRERRYVSTDAY